MKRIFAVLLLLCGTNIAFGQVSPQTPGVGPPTGPCTSTTTYLDTNAHQTYNCNNGTWVLTGSGSQYQTLPLLTTYNNAVLVANGIPAIVAKADAAAQAANIAATTLYTVPASGAGMYRVSFYAVITQAATTSSTLPFGQIVYTDNDTSLTNTATFTNTNTANAVGSVAALFTGGGSMPVLNVKPGTIIQYQTTSYASTGATPMQYAVHIKLEYLGN